MSVNTELERYDGKVKAESRKRLDRYSERGVKEHCAGCALIAECHFKVGVEADLKRDERRVRAAEERLSPLVLAFYICTDVTAAESDFPLAVRNACARFEDDRSVEVEFHRAFAVGIAVLLLAGIFKLFCELVHIFGEVVCVEIDGNAVVIVFRTLIGADKRDDTECRRVLSRQDHQVDEVVAARARQISEEDKAFPYHIVDVDAAENRADVGRISQLVANLFAYRLCTVVFVGKVRLIGNVCYAKGHIDISDFQRAARKYRRDACCGSFCRVVNAVRSHIGVRHHIRAAKHRNGGEREYEIRCAVELVQICYLSCLYALTRKIGLSGELFPVCCVEGKFNDARAFVCRVSFFAVYVFTNSDRFTRQGDIGVEYRFREVRGNTDIISIIYNVAGIGRRSLAVKILPILLTCYLRRRCVASVILKAYNKIGGIF